MRFLSKTSKAALAKSAVITFEREARRNRPPSLPSSFLPVLLCVSPACQLLLVEGTAREKGAVAVLAQYLFSETSPQFVVRAFSTNQNRCEPKMEVHMVAPTPEGVMQLRRLISSTVPLISVTTDSIPGFNWLLGAASIFLVGCTLRGASSLSISLSLSLTFALALAPSLCLPLSLSRSSVRGLYRVHCRS